MPVGIEVKNLAKHFDGVEALAGVSVSFAAGKLHGLIGSDGAGKTTLMRLLLNLLNIDSGTITYLDDGKPVPLTTIRDQVSYMPSRASLYPDLSITEHLEFFREIYMIDEKDFRARVEKLLEVTRLGKFADRKAGQLSGGMYKKLGLMCALLQQPRALLLDEPTNGVDPISRREFWDLLYSLAEEKILIVIATAYMDEAERCHEVHLLDEGKLIGSGAPRALLAASGVRSFDELYIRRETERENAKGKRNDA
jgi:ABC-2 type transport system ATP-binding protein